jgi:CDP-diacylglycerol--glycerol-3-phosphate 3-phosphatidyltransferase
MERCHPEDIFEMAWRQFGIHRSTPNEKRADQLTSHPSQYADVFRIVSVPIVRGAADDAQPVHGALAGLIFSVAAITDYFDGYLARRYGLVSNLGKVMDPVADKLLVLLFLDHADRPGWMPAWIACIIIGRELAVTGLRNIMAQNKQDVSASSLGNTKPGFRLPPSFP